MYTFTTYFVHCKNQLSNQQEKKLAPLSKQSYINFSKQTITTNISPPLVSSANAIFERGE